LGDTEDHPVEYGSTVWHPLASVPYNVDYSTRQGMDYLFPVIGDADCAKCGRTVSISVVGDPYNLNAPHLDSACRDPNCPVNEENRPNDIQIVTICFVDEDSQE